MTETGLDKFLTELSGAYLIKLAGGTREAWRRALAPVGDGEALVALRAHIDGDSKTPRPADILRLCRESGGAKIPQVGPLQRLAILNRQAQAKVTERLSRNDEREVSFQRFMLYRSVAAGLTPDDERYFRRTLGDEDTDDAIRARQERS